jgi:hypothetical protein
MEWDWQHWVALAVWTWVWEKWVSHHWYNVWAWATQWWN